MTIHYSDESVTIHHGDCLDILRTLPDASVDAVVTDPPAGIAFMSAKWDGDKGGRERWSAWLADVMREALRVTKPGGHALVWALPRTSHWTACGIEDAGWEIRDRVSHLFGSGFPKSLDVSKAIDKQRNEDREPLDRVRGWLNERRLAAGFSHDAVNKHFGHASNGGGSSSAWMTNPTSRSLPTWGQWLELKALFGSNDDMDAEVWRLNGRKGKPGDNWDSREVIGTGQAGLTAGSIANFRGEKTFDLTAPATEAARRWSGWGTALKPAAEDWWLARKPLAAGTVAGNVLAYGTGALNIDGCRVATPDGTSRPRGTFPHSDDAWGDGRPGEVSETHPAGRWPANVVLSHGEDCGDRCVPGCAVAELDAQSGELTSGAPAGIRGISAASVSYADMAAGSRLTGYGDTGGASRFFSTFRYEAKADTAERPRHGEVAHPTVKSLGLMRWLVRLVTPPGGTVLDMFLGSGTTAEACQAEGFRCIGVEREADYLPLIVQRVTKRADPVRHLADKGDDLGLLGLLDGEAS